MKYADKLKDPRWQKKRLEIFERDEWTCQVCKSKDETLCVHHWYYEKGKSPWDYPNSSLTTMCMDCHGTEHEARRESEDLMLSVLKKNRVDFEGMRSLAHMVDSCPVPITMQFADMLVDMIGHPELLLESLRAYQVSELRAKGRWTDPSREIEILEVLCKKRGSN